MKKMLWIGTMMLVTIAPAPVVEAQPEDGFGFDCRMHGNQICGPDNPAGAPAGRYDEGILVESWPDMLARCGRSDICLGA